MASDGIAVGPDPAQAVEHRLAGLERHLVALPAPGAGLSPRQTFSCCDIAHCAAAWCATAGTEASAMPPSSSRATWLTRHCGSIRGNPRAGGRRGFRCARAPPCATDARDHQHVAQVEPFEPRAGRSAALSPGGRSPSARVRSSIVASARASFASVRNGPTSSAMVACKRLDHGGGVDVAALDRCRRADRARSRAAAGRNACAAHALGPLGGAAAGAAAEHQRLGDGVAGQPVGAVGAAHRLAGDQQARHLGLHALVGDDAAHVVVRDRRHLDRHPGEIDAVRGEPVDHRAERRAQLRLRAVLEAQIGAAMRRAAPGLHLLDDGVGRDVAGDDVACRPR